MDSSIIGVDPVYLRIFRNVLERNYDIKPILDSLTQSQLESKVWMIDILSMLELDRLSIQLYGGWNGFPFVDLLINEFDIDLLENIDIDEKAIALYKNFIHLKKLDKSVYRCRLCDVREPFRTDRQVNLVINTSSEHMPDLPELIKGKEYSSKCIFALQSNNMFHIPDHINCVNSEHELAEKSGISDIHYMGNMKMDNGYTRYMVIGSRVKI